MATIDEVAWPLAKVDPLQPPAEFADLRSECPFAKAKLWNERSLTLVLRYYDVRKLLADPHTSSDHERADYPHISLAAQASQNEQKAFVHMDPPKHTSHRRMLSSHFRLANIQRYQPMVEELVERLIDELEACEQPVDLVHEFAQRLPAIVTAKLLGMPEEDGEFLQRKVNEFMDFSGSPEVPRRAAEQIRAYFEDLIDRRMDSSDDDLTSTVIREHLKRGELSREELCYILQLLLVGGFDTTASVISVGTLVFLKHSDQLQRMLDQPELGHQAVEELLRFITPTQESLIRLAAGDIEVGGDLIRNEDAVVASLYAANHDPEVFEKPSEFDVMRDARGHVAFGFGPHQCLGQPLARLELRSVFPRLFQRLPGLRLACDESDLSFSVHGVFGLNELPVRF